MTHRSTIKVLDSGQTLCVSELSSTSHPLHRYSGLVDEEGMLFFNYDYEGAPILCISCRVGAVAVQPEVGQNNKEIFVSPGRPANLYVDALTESNGSMRIRSLSGRSEIELLYTNGALSAADTAPDPEWLILNASAEGGVDRDFQNVVSALRDVNTYTLVSQDWLSDSTEDAVFIAADADFGGKSSIDMSASARLTPIASDSSFSFVNVNQTFTFMGILKVNDDAADNTEFTEVWNNGAYGGLPAGGVGIEVGPDYRARLLKKSAGSSLVKLNDTEELFDKPFVYIMIYKITSPGEATVRVYWQGKWRTVHEYSFNDGDAAKLVIGDRTGGSGRSSYKFADLRWKNAEPTQAEIDEYLAMATAEYGIDDSIQQGFPLVGSGRFWRASRGFTSSSWKDTVPGGSGGGTIDVYGLTQPAPFPEYANRAAWYADGSNDYLELPVISELAGGGGVGMTLSMIYSPIAGKEDDEAASLFSMDQYASSNTSGSAALAGTNVLYDDGDNFSDGFTIRIDNSSDAEVVNIYPSGNYNVAGDVYLLIVETDVFEQTWTVTQYNVTKNTIVYSQSGDWSGTLDAGTAVRAKMFRFHTLTGVEGWLKGTLSDLFVLANHLDATQRSAMIDYARQRYR